MGNFFAKPAGQASVQDLPNEVLVIIFEKISLHELVTNCANICVRWRELVAQRILGPKITKLANVNGKFKMDIVEKGWIEEAINPTELIMSLYDKYDHFTSKFFFLLDCHYLLSSTIDFCSFRNQGAGLIWMEWKRSSLH